MHNHRLFVLVAIFLGFACGSAIADPVRDAIKAGDVKKIQQLLGQVTPIDVPDEQGNTPLHDAVAEAQLEIVKLLLSPPASSYIDTANKKGETPLHLAGSKGRPKILSLLIEHGADINARDHEGKTALCRAAFEGRPETLQALLDKGADIKGLPGDSFEYDGHYDAAPLECAVRGGKRGAISLLLKNGAAINDDVLTPVITRGDRDTLQIFLAKGAHLGNRAMTAAIAGGQRDMIHYLVDNGAVIDDPGMAVAITSGDRDLINYLVGKKAVVGGEAMAAAIATNKRDLISDLLDKGGVIDYQILALRNRQQIANFDRDMLQFLLARGRNSRERAAPLLLVAIMDQNPAQAMTLIDLGVGVNGRDEYGNSPLHRAAEFGNAELCQQLLKKGANINARTERDNTPLHKAVVGEYVEVVKVLLAGGADVNAVNEIKITPLHMAAARNQAEIVGLLLRQGADITLRAYNNWTAGEIAANNGHTDLARVLGVNTSATALKAATPSSPAANTASPVPSTAANPAPPVATTPGLEIKAPLQAENGAVVPVMVSINPAITAGDQLAVFVNNEIACTLQPTGKVALTGFSTRLRLPGNGQVRMVVTRQKGGQTTSSANISVTTGATIPLSGKASNTPVKTKTRGDELLMLYNNDMAMDTYIKAILVTLRSGGVKISTTPKLSRDPLLGIKTPDPLDDAIVEATLNRP